MLGLYGVVFVFLVVSDGGEFGLFGGIGIGGIGGGFFGFFMCGGDGAFFGTAVAEKLTYFKIF